MIQISDNADRQIVKLVGKEGLPPTGGLRVGVKAGGCSGLSYVFAWEPDAKPGDQVIAGARARGSSSIPRATASSTARRSTTTPA